MTVNFYNFHTVFLTIEKNTFVSRYSIFVHSVFFFRKYLIFATTLESFVFENLTIIRCLNLVNLLHLEGPIIKFPLCLTFDFDVLCTNTRAHDFEI